jgi:galactokinase
VDDRFSLSTCATRATVAFTNCVGRPPVGCWTAPGRVTVIGEHTDYNDGYVLPIALPYGVCVAAAPRADRQVVARSLQQPDSPVHVTEDALRPRTIDGWGAYPAGVVWALRAAGHDVGGVEIMVDSDLSTGGGLSSSAALECAVALACVELFSLDIPRPELARLAQHAENEFVGVPVGVMDPSASLRCRAGHALFLDARSLECEHIPFDLESAGLRLLVIDTRAPHRLLDGEYANRRGACETAATTLNVPALRDVPAAGLEHTLTTIADTTIRRRARHVVTENARVVQVVELLHAGNIAAIGPLLTASHTSLRDDFEVSSEELDTAVDAALGAGAIGARMTGGGFGGCAIALVHAADVAAVSAATEQAFDQRRFASPRIFSATAAGGARRATDREAGGP